MGGWVAASSTTKVVAPRIGYFAAMPPRDGSARDMAAWLSPGDCADLLRTAVEANVAGCVVVNGNSANRYWAADLDTALRFGYRPTDDAWTVGEGACSPNRRHPPASRISWRCGQRPGLWCRPRYEGQSTSTTSLR